MLVTFSRTDLEQRPVAERYKLDGAAERPLFFTEWRDTKGWTQQQLADELKTSKQTVSRIESGAREWGKGYVEAFGHAIGCHPLAPLLTPPRDDVDVSAVLYALELSSSDLSGVSRNLRSLSRASAPERGHAAKGQQKPKLKESR